MFRILAMLFRFVFWPAITYVEKERKEEAGSMWLAVVLQITWASGLVIAILAIVLRLAQ